MRRIALAIILLAASASLHAATSTFSFEKDPLVFREGDGTGTIKVLRGGDLTTSKTTANSTSFAGSCV